MRHKSSHFKEGKGVRATIEEASGEESDIDGEREDRMRGRRKEKVAVTSGHGHSAVLNKNNGFLNLHRHRFETIEAMQCGALKGLARKPMHVNMVQCKNCLSLK